MTTMKKRFIPLILALLILLSACGGGLKSTVTEENGATGQTATAETETGKTGPAGDTSGFCVGVGRADITPESSVPLAGYGNTSNRMSKNVLDKLYATCVAIRDDSGETILLFNLDIINLKAELANILKQKVSKATGVPEDHIMTNCTHTHSAPDALSAEGSIGPWKAKLYKAAEAAAVEAMADLDACTIYVGATNTERLNFVRRYYLTNGFATDNAEYGSGEITSHETEVDEEMRLIRFVRADRKDIVLANWQCHPHRTGGASRYDISADIIGVWRKEAESNGDMVFAYFQGGAGNINPVSRISGEALYSDYKDIGKALCRHMNEGLADAMKEMPAGKVRVATATLTQPYNHENEDKLEQAKEIASAFSSGGNADAKPLCEKYGISSPYEAQSIVSRVNRPENGEIPLACYAIGDIAITAAPFEMFCQTEKKLREDSPFAFTFTCGYSNDSQSYMPAADCFDNLGYEVAVCHYVKGTAEAISAKQLELLNALYAEA